MALCPSGFLFVIITQQRDGREFKKLRQLLQRQRHIKIELCVRLSVRYVVKNKRSALSLGTNGFLVKIENKRLL